MSNYYNELITVKDYANSLRYDPANESSMIRVEDYVASIRTNAVQAQTSDFITVKEYVKTLNNERYLTPVELALAERIEKAVSDKLNHVEKTQNKLSA